MYHGGYTIFGRHSNRALNSLLQRSGKRQDLFPFFVALFCYLSEILIAGYRAGHFFGRGGDPVIHTGIKGWIQLVSATVSKVFPVNKIPSYRFVDLKFLKQGEYRLS